MCKAKGAAKANPIQAWTGPYGVRRLRIPGFLDNRHLKVANSSVLSTGRLYPAGDNPGTHLY